jgi:hypothetical protein
MAAVGFEATDEFVREPTSEECCVGIEDLGLVDAESSSSSAHVLMGDGAVIFITDSIEAGQEGSDLLIVNNGDGSDFLEDAEGGRDMLRDTESTAEAENRDGGDDGTDDDAGDIILVDIVG